MDINKLSTELNDILDSSQIQDYCANGLQLACRGEIDKLAVGVTASMEMIEKAIEIRANALFVHHGLFWGSNIKIDRWLYERVEMLVKNNVGVIAYHLPLDIHEDFGTAKCLADFFNITITGKYGFMRGKWLGVTGQTDLTFSQIIEKLHENSIEAEKVFNYGKDPIEKIALMPGDGASFIDEAALTGATTIITGEYNGPAQYICKELGINFIALGHEVSESFFIDPVCKFIKEKFGIESIGLKFKYLA
ncbi:Nif3-like dinuclear metal center hexameric protein [Myxococcota bacterium]|nr:Nif3-like dinuclear metal center hexameric protein [Myxococcota bacterium]MBU1382186.1 Nif3-like dinuclear metal center hexameric protein [Myxococcota bacterium]MBU1498724.1 Nif3-like dinuclear metal center hexameric protein [Myxococcota bacterium]